MRLKLILALVLTFSFTDITAQIPKKYQNKNTYSDSLALDYLKKMYPSRTIGWSVITLKNKKQNVRNYNSYVSFKLPIKIDEISADTITVINFGTTSEHDPCFMLVLYQANNEVMHFVLGMDALGVDVESLQHFFNSLQGKMEEKYQLEIWDLFIKCRQGVVYTPLYFH